MFKYAWNVYWFFETLKKPCYLGDQGQLFYCIESYNILNFSAGCKSRMRMFYKAESHQVVSSILLAVQRAGWKEEGCPPSNQTGLKCRN